MEPYEIEIHDDHKFFSVYSTPDKVVFKGKITLDERTWDWLMRDVHLGSVRQEIVWAPQ